MRRNEEQNTHVIAELVNRARSYSKGSRIVTLGHYVVSSTYGQAQFILGILNTVLATVVASTTLLASAENSKFLTSFLSFSVALLSALLTFLNADDKKKFHLDGATEFEDLEDKFELFINITINSGITFQELSTNLDELVLKYKQLRKAYPIPNWAWQYAKKRTSEARMNEEVGLV